MARSNSILRAADKIVAAAVLLTVNAAAFGQVAELPSVTRFPGIEQTPTDPTPPSVAPPAGSTPKESGSGEAGKTGSVDDAAKPDKPASVAGWDNGFFLRSSDKQFNLRLTGQIQGDYRGYLDHRDLTDISTFNVRRARLGIEANVLDMYEFRLLPDFGQGVARIFDSYINIRFRDGFQVEVGKFKQPFSYEQLIQDRYVPTMERSLIDPLVPARDDGLMIHGQKLLGDRVDYAASISNGQNNGDGDLSSGVDGNFRLAVRPFRQVEAWPALQHLQIGAAYTIGREVEAINPAILRTPANVPWFQFLPGVLADGTRWRFSPEVAYFFHGLGMAAQYFHMEQWMRAAGAAAIPRDVFFNGYYVMTTLLLTGEERTTYSAPIAPLKPFDPKHPLASPGALEAVFRYSHVDLSDDVFFAGASRLADPTKVSNGASEVTVGFNWYLNRYVRSQFNWEHAWFDRPVLLGPAPAGALRIQNTLFARLQVIF